MLGIPYYLLLENILSINMQINTTNHYYLDN